MEQCQMGLLNLLLSDDVLDLIRKVNLLHKYLFKVARLFEIIFRN